MTGPLSEVGTPLAGVVMIGFWVIVGAIILWTKISDPMSRKRRVRITHYTSDGRPWHVNTRLNGYEIARMRRDGTQVDEV